MINLNAMRNKFIDKTVNLLNSVKYTPDQHDTALNAIIDNANLSDEEKLTQMKDYFKDTMLENAFAAALEQARNNHA